MSEEIAIWSRDALAQVPRQLLVTVRKVIHACRDLQELFETAHADRWPTPALSAKLRDTLPTYLDDVTPEAVASVAQFLAEEFAERDTSKALIVSRETGLPVAQVPANALQSVGDGLSMLAPQVEATLATHEFETAQEMRALEKLAERIRSTALLRQTGDRRLAVVHKRGRASIVGQVREALARSADLANDILDICRFCDEPPETGLDVLEVDVSARMPLLVSDVKALNLEFATANHIHQTFQVQWVRQVVRCVAARVHRSGPVLRVGVATEQGDVRLVAAPEIVLGYVQAGPRRVGVPVRDAAALLLDSGIQLFVNLVPGSLVCVSHDSGGIWEVTASASLLVYWSPSRVRAVSFSDIDEGAIVAEVVT